MIYSQAQAPEVFVSICHSGPEAPLPYDPSLYLAGQHIPSKAMQAFDPE